MQTIDLIGSWLNEKGKLVEVPTWQALDVRNKPQGTTFELTDISFYHELPATSTQLADEIKPNLPWAENQFLERVAGEPLNPGETFKEWPWYKGNVEQHKEQGQFSHTYMERFWPHSAFIQARKDEGREGAIAPKGIRYGWGELSDVVNLLAHGPTTRQAYLPIFFPEDTGAVHGERIPCSLGYLFLMREGKLNITYYIRSCDFYRHFRDDVYMTARLCQWVLDQLKKGEVNDEFWQQIEVGRLTMHIGSLHVFEGDLPRLRREYA